MGVNEKRTKTNHQEKDKIGATPPVVAAQLPQPRSQNVGARCVNVVVEDGERVRESDAIERQKGVNGDAAPIAAEAFDFIVMTVRSAPMSRKSD